MNQGSPSKILSDCSGPPAAGVSVTEWAAFRSARFARLSSALRRLVFSRSRLANVFRCLAISHTSFNLCPIVRLCRRDERQVFCTALHEIRGLVSCQANTVRKTRERAIGQGRAGRRPRFCRFLFERRPTGLALRASTESLSLELGWGQQTLQRRGHAKDARKAQAHEKSFAVLQEKCGGRTQMPETRAAFQKTHWT